MTSPVHNISDVPLLVIMGPTASGKSAMALHLAQTFNGEIISADSMQIYRGLDIGTAKPLPNELAAVPHHLISVFDFNQRVDVYTFVELAVAAINDIRQRGKLPVIAGGTGMYLHALLYGIDELPGDRILRGQLDQEYDNDAGFAALKELMCRRDPAAFALWQSNRRKLIRALEVLELTGQSITTLHSGKNKTLKYPVTAWKLERDRDDLKAIIAKRAKIMLASGWIEEAEAAISNGLLQSPTARQAIGYRLIAEYLNGGINYSALEERITTVTWQFARRQITWFKHQHPEAETVKLPAEYKLLEEKLYGSMDWY